MGIKYDNYGIEALSIDTLLFIFATIGRKQLSRNKGNKKRSKTRAVHAVSNALLQAFNQINMLLSGLNRFKLKEIREQKGISLRDLALDADLSANTISEIELGKRDPRMTTVVKLASAFGIDPADLLPKL